MAVTLGSLDSEISNYRRSSASLFKEVGSARESLEGLFRKTEKAIDDTDRKEYREMWQNDGQVAAIVKLPQLLMLGAGFKIIDSTGSAKEELDYVHSVLLGSPRNGGMQTSIESVIEDMSYAPFEGVRFYELVFTRNGGKIGIKKIAPRDNLTCYPVVDDSGAFIGYVQRVDVAGQTKEAFIGVPKAITIVYNEAYGGANGLSMLRAAHYHWDKKHKLYFIGHLASELQTIPPKIIKNKGMNDDVKGALEQAVDEIGLQARITVPSDGAEIEVLGNGGTPTVDIKELIAHHDSLMSKSLLANWIDLGSETSNSGSRALGSSMIDVYMQFVSGMMRKIENIFNNDIIPLLVDYNFSSDVYPEFRFNPIRDDAKQTLTEVFKEFAKSGKIAVSGRASIIGRVSEDLGIEFDESEYEQEEQATAPTGQQDTNTQQDPSATPDVATDGEMMDGNNGQDSEDNTSNGPVELADRANNRPLFLQEQRIDFAQLSSKVSGIVDRTVSQLSELIAESLPGVQADVRRALESGDITALGNLQVADSSQMITILEYAMKEIYEIAKVGASEEIAVDVEQTPTGEKSLMSLSAVTNIGKLLADLRANIINIVKSDYVSGVSPEDTVNTVGIETNKTTGSRLGTVVLMNIFNSLAQARWFVFNRNSDRITGYLYSAVLDDRTTEFCRSLDGKFFKAGSVALANITPPNHYNCRSILVPVLSSDPQPRWEGAQPTSYDSINDFRDTVALADYGLAQKEIALSRVEATSEAVSGMKKIGDLLEKTVAKRHEELDKKIAEILEEL